MDHLRITGLEVRTHIGVPEAERQTEQRLLVTVSMETDARAVASEDDICAGINYADVAEDILHLAKTERKTIERFAEDIANAILKKYTTKSVTVRIDKFVLSNAKSTSIEIQRP